MIDISMLSNKQNKNQNTSWISLCGKLEAYIGNYFCQELRFLIIKLKHYIMMPRLIKMIVWN